VSFAIEEPEIERQHGENKQTEAYPQPGCATQCVHEGRKISSEFALEQMIKSA
jgi:hypothetical protein